MSLKTRLVLAASGVVLILFGVSEWLSYTQIAAHLNQWEALLEQSGARATATAHLRSEGAFLFEKLAVLWCCTAVVTCLMLLLVLNYLWRSLVETRLNELLAHIESMSRGAWTDPVSDSRKDEVGSLTEAFNQLGDRLAFTVQQFATASKLSALAIVGQRLVRRVMLVREHLAAIRSLLGVAHQQRQEVPEAALRNLDAAAASLAVLETEFQREFDRELSRHTVPSGLVAAGPSSNGGSGGGFAGAGLPAPRARSIR